MTPVWVTRSILRIHEELNHRLPSERKNEMIPYGQHRSPPRPAPPGPGRQESSTPPAKGRGAGSPPARGLRRPTRRRAGSRGGDSRAAGAELLPAGCPPGGDSRCVTRTTSPARRLAGQRPAPSRCAGPPQSGVLSVPVPVPVHFPPFPHTTVPGVPPRPILRRLRPIPGTNPPPPPPPRPRCFLTLTRHVPDPTAA
uniref:Uncharacterized protein n=1 Tax=Rangifer tarandus platyrhynchus TaxID=3082113 RepID=A0ACB0ESC1_RANTA|nr:unnamed protein product [Rangifer tarandus platyrhynchus]